MNAPEIITIPCDVNRDIVVNNLISGKNNIIHVDFTNGKSIEEIVESHFAKTDKNTQKNIVKTCKKLVKQEIVV